MCVIRLIWHATTPGFPDSEALHGVLNHAHVETRHAFAFSFC